MSKALREARTICKTIMRNGYDAYIINARLQRMLLGCGGDLEIDVSTEMPFDELKRLFPAFRISDDDPSIIGTLEESGVLYHFFHSDIEDGSYTEECVARVTPRILECLKESGEIPAHLACPYNPRPIDVNDGFGDFGCDEVRLLGLPDENLKQNYLRAVKALRFAANYHLPIEANTWLAIVRAGRRVLDYVSIADIMDEWRKVEPENMWEFVKLLYESMILHGLIPEIAALQRVRHIKNPDEGEEDVLAHTIEVMRRYPEELPYDWLGTFACLFHDVGKLFTAEYSDNEWTFYQHHRVGAKITRKVLKRLRFDPEDIDLISHLVNNHMRFHFMLTDAGIRRFKSLTDYPRLIEIARADLKARGGKYREFNHNVKMLDRTNIPEEMLEPLLNGHEIMEFAEIKPGPQVGIIRDALLQAQIEGRVTSIPDAVDFVMRYREKELAAKLS